MPAGNNMATAAALLGILLVAPACGVRLADKQAYLDCVASATCTDLCARPTRAPHVQSLRACVGARGASSRAHAPPSPSGLPSFKSTADLSSPSPATHAHAPVTST